jgi:hypothetical protein
MKTSSIKSDLLGIARKISPQATYSDVMYELYVRMKIAAGAQAAKKGCVIPHQKVKKKFVKQ